MSQLIKFRGVKTRPFIMAASAGVLAVAGAWYGAGLKEKQQRKQVRKLRILVLNCAQIVIESFSINIIKV